jgi:hypothetical protein
MNALKFLYKLLLTHVLPGRINAVRTDKTINVKA